MLNIKKENLALIKEAQNTEFGFSSMNEAYVIRDTGNKVIGFANLSFENNTCYIIELEILYAYRYMGYGSKFVKQLFNDFNLNEVYGKANFSTVGFWNSLGANIDTPCDGCDYKDNCEYDEDILYVDDCMSDFTICKDII